MEQWKDFEFNEPYGGPEISTINGFSLRNCCIWERYTNNRFLFCGLREA